MKMIYPKKIYLPMISFVKNHHKSAATRSFFTRIFPVMMLSMVLVNPAYAKDDVSFIEATKSRRSETLGDIYTFGVYGSVASNSSYNTYAGMQFMFLDDNEFGGNDSAIKILIGQELNSNFAPFYEIGTDLYGLITLFDDDRETQTCRTDERCSIDFFFRIGLRIKLAETISLGIFHEDINFGNFHETVSGGHRYVGSSLAIQF